VTPRWDNLTKTGAATAEHCLLYYRECKYNTCYIVNLIINDENGTM